MVATYPNCGKPVKTYKENCVNIISAFSGNMEKRCCKCKENKTVSCFGKLNTSSDGLRYDCNDCRKEYRDRQKENIKEKNTSYYKMNKNRILSKNKEYRENNSDRINQQRIEYRSRPDVKEHIKEKNREYLPIKKMKIRERRKIDVDFQLSEILRSKLHKMLKNQKTSYAKYIGCDIEWLKAWLSFRFDDKMSWDNFGSYWQIDHILPLSGFNFTNENDVRICFHWTNLQPLSSEENRVKSNKLIMHYYFNNIVNIFRYNKSHTQFLGYQAVNESLQWLRIELRYGKNPPYKCVSNTHEIGNPQPSL